jgi:3-hydroxymyristoyl/3-hydroxydecanoyl-(acyl carrier protein) dehydratase
MLPEQLESLARRGRKHPLFEFGASHAVELERAQVEQMLPHRDPFLFIDRVTAVDLDALAISGERRIDPRDPVFAGHFPGAPVYPGVLQIETMGQLGLCLFGLRKVGNGIPVAEGGATQVRAVKVHHAVFAAPVYPGDDLTILARIVESDGFFGICAGQLLKGDTVCCFGIVEVYFVEP